jgi:hypothetical protein
VQRLSIGSFAFQRKDVQLSCVIDVTGVPSGVGVSDVGCGTSLLGDLDLRGDERVLSLWAVSDWAESDDMGVEKVLLGIAGDESVREVSRKVWVLELRSSLILP